MMTFKVLAALLTYPDAEMQAAADEMTAAIDAEALLGPDGRAAVRRLIDRLADEDLIDAQARYVDLFDSSRSFSLHLFEHVHGESRDRGQAMVDLRMLYARHGLVQAPGELPDFLPAYLEFLSLLPIEAARRQLADAAHIVAALGERLAAADPLYAGLLAAVVGLADALPDGARVAAVKAACERVAHEETDPDSTWAEAPVTFGPANPAAPGATAGR